MKLPRPAKLDEMLEPLQLSGLNDGAQLQNVHVENAALLGQEAKHVSIEGSALEGIELSSSKLKMFSIVDGRIENCLLFGTNFDGSNWERVAIRGGMHTGAVMSDANFVDVSFTDAKLNMVNFRVSKFSRVTFERCDLTEADFQGAKLANVRFKDCDLTNTEFGNCSVEIVDLRGSNVAGTKGLSGLRGAIVDEVQLISMANAMAHELGLKVE